MKKLFYILSLSLLTCISCNENSHIDNKENFSIDYRDRHGWVEDLPIYGDIVRVTQNNYGNNYQEQFGKYIPIGRPISQTIYEFNRMGHVERVIEKDCNNEIYDETKYTYDSKGNCISKTRISGGVEYIERYTLDNKGICIECDIFRNGEFTGKETYKYDSNKCQIERVIYNEDGKKEMVWSKKYNNFNKPYEHYVEHFHPYASPKILCSTWSYDSIGNEIQYCIYNREVTPSVWRNSEYDTQGRKISCTIYLSTDKNGNKVAGGTISTKTEYAYDDRGNIQSLWLGHYAYSNDTEYTEFKIEYRSN